MNDEQIGAPDAPSTAAEEPQAAPASAADLSPRAYTRAELQARQRARLGGARPAAPRNSRFWAALWRECPECHAPPGLACRVTVHGLNDVTTESHTARLAAPGRKARRRAARARRK